MVPKVLTANSVFRSDRWISRISSTHHGRHEPSVAAELSVDRHVGRPDLAGVGDLDAVEAPDPLLGVAAADASLIRRR